ncbi:hypothetical protein A1O3_08966 [Capronia epimyces CBS 606.96]|uniref:Uncharacterized protein n=1 Tax=Capronia epimyces CBS 606.96 TaxID=1182542 RepID=W9YAR9_9EURO|nr:uncharacterized protein A1O3_08966 [Capronia epimyces CBS 606.96]EXJ79464.1 hypothetical protein A1O3_08966 [Capronia epimyces CBS 606.96]
MKSRSSSVSSGSSSSSGSSKSGGSEGSKADEDEAADVERIASAATWAQEALGIKEESLNSLWYERLGDTCYAFSEYAAARDRFEKAKNLPDTRWTANQGWAVATFELGMADNSEELKMLACDEMETVLTVLRGLFKSGSASDVECRMLVENVKQLASWQKGLNQLDKTLALYQEALEVDPYEHGTHCDLLQLLYKQNKLEDARKSLLGSPGQDVTTGVRDRDTSIFVSLLQYLAETEDDEGHLGVMNIIVILAGADQTFSQFTLEALQSAIVDARKNNNTVGEGILLLYQGIILARGSADNNRIQQAARSWEDCMSLYLTFQYHLMRTQDYAARYMTQYYFNQSINQSRQVSLQGGDDEHEQHFSKLLRISRQSANWSHSFKPDSYLAACYVQQGKLDKARALFMDDMIMALEILSDQDPDNDYYGYKYLANILMHVGDDLNALSAWSLLGPSDLFRSKEEDGHSESEGAKESEPEPEPESVEDTRSISEGQHEHQREGPLTYRCDGGCGHYWTYASDMYICRFCPDTQFTGDCLEKVRTGKLERFICHPVHSWLHVPVWSDEEALAVGQGRVKVRGSLVDGQRVGGEVVDIKDWLDELREQWNVPSL